MNTQNPRYSEPLGYRFRRALGRLREHLRAAPDPAPYGLGMKPLNMVGEGPGMPDVSPAPRREDRLMLVDGGRALLDAKNHWMDRALRAEAGLAATGAYRRNRASGLDHKQALKATSRSLALQDERAAEDA